MEPSEPSFFNPPYIKTYSVFIFVPSHTVRYRTGTVLYPIIHGAIEILDAHKLPFTNKHQPSLASIALRAEAKRRKTSASRQLSASRLAQGPIITKLKNMSNFKIGVAQKVPGVVECNNCHKPRCIYSNSATSQMKPPLPPPSNEDTTSEPVTSQHVQEYRALVKDMLHDAM
jgi:hypothetical protein